MLDTACIFYAAKRKEIGCVNLVQCPRRRRRYNYNHTDRGDMGDGHQATRFDNRVFSQYRGSAWGVLNRTDMLLFV